MNKLLLGMVSILSLALAGCQQTTMNKQNVGAVGGAVVGGVLGSQVGSGSGRLWTTGAGVLLGALLGSEVGASLDRADKMYMHQANQRAHTAPVGETISWNNPESGHRGSITPVRDGHDQVSNSYCREYEQTIYIDGRAETGVGTACQLPDGRWEFRNS